MNILRKAADLLDFNCPVRIEDNTIKCGSIFIIQNFDNDEYLDRYQFKVHINFLRKDFDYLLLLDKRGNLELLTDEDTCAYFKIPTCGYINLIKMGVDIEEMPHPEVLSRLGFQYVTLSLIEGGDSFVSTISIKLDTKFKIGEYTRSIPIKRVDNRSLIKNINIIRSIYYNNF